MHGEEFVKITECSECGGVDIIEDYERGEIICQRCGLVVNENVIDRGAEWRAFTKEEGESRIRAGMPISYATYDKGLYTVINNVNRDAKGKQLQISTSLKMLKLMKCQNKIRSHRDRNLVQAMVEIEKLADFLHIPKQVKERTAIIYRKALDKRLIQGRSIAAVVAASLFIACRSSEIPRNLKELSAISGESVRDIFLCYRILLQELDIRLPVEDPIGCVSKIASKMQIPFKTQARAEKILRGAKRIGVATSKNPMGLAASALYLACVLNTVNIKQKEIAKVANVTDVTIRNRYKELREL
ncbi:MAG: transcription initiation factor IIB [Candidatus Bathyarchaeota archaeon]|nr:transcription initiation factor IIB [Candidatus Bathyarchaeota archaeon]